MLYSYQKVNVAIFCCVQNKQGDNSSLFCNDQVTSGIFKFNLEY